jgi:hypothetical protein
MLRSDLSNTENVYISIFILALEGIVADLRRDFWMHATGTGQQVAQLHDRYVMMMIYWHYAPLVFRHSPKEYWLFMYKLLADHGFYVPAFSYKIVSKHAITPTFYKKAFEEFYYHVYCKSGVLIW